MSREPPLLGAHVSTAGGLPEAIPNGEALGCDAIQVFARGQRQWRARPLSDPDVALFRERMAGSRIRVALSHDSYLINLGSGRRRLHARSREAFREELARAEALGIPWVVFHPGAHMGGGAAAAISRIRETVAGLLAETRDSRTGVLLETAAGQGTAVGWRFEELGEMLRGMRPARRVGVCFDTCHVFAAGYELRTPSGYQATMRELDRTVGLAHVKAFHLNDSKRERGSRVDRHANLGRGHLGIEPFRLLLNDERFAGLPMVLETPGGPAGFRRDLGILRGLRGRGARSR
ncbi:MAG: deoxyribonuclease IV [Planctomycetales bacterium]|nr:deoxyribonuclease IV [Planctomycetales bacterium]